MTEDHYALFASRGVDVLGPAEIAKFGDAVRLMATHEMESAYNMKRLRDLNSVVFHVKATHTGGAKAAKSPASECGLESDLLLAVGARVMLRTNVWTTKGLTNGALGTLVELIAPAAKSMPSPVLVRFDTYDGPAFFPDDPKLVPIVPTTVHFGSTKSMSRTSLPLILAWAITIHKSQGATYERAVVSLGGKELSLGLTYVALSRVKGLAGLLLVGNYSRDRILRTNLHSKHAEREAAEAWLDTLPTD